MQNHLIDHNAWAENLQVQQAFIDCNNFGGAMGSSAWQ